MKHTPGPWRRVRGMVFNPSGKGHVATIGTENYIYGNGDAKDVYERDANAKLIAAAPELVECLRELTQMSAHGVPGSISYHDRAGAMDKARALLQRIEE